MDAFSPRNDSPDASLGGWVSRTFRERMRRQDGPQNPRLCRNDRESNMKKTVLSLLVAGSAALGACTTYDTDPRLEGAATGAAIGAAAGAVGGAIIPGISPVEGAVVGGVVGGVAGAIAADRDGDGVNDGYYKDGVYHAYDAPPPPPAYTPPPPPPSYRSGERG
jgi:hypothetical protein